MEVKDINRGNKFLGLSEKLRGIAFIFEVFTNERKMFIKISNTGKTFSM